MRTIKEIQEDVRGYDSIIRLAEAYSDNPLESFMHKETECVVIPKKALDDIINECSKISLEMLRYLELNK